MHILPAYTTNNPAIRYVQKLHNGTRKSVLNVLKTLMHASCKHGSYFIQNYSQVIHQTEVNC